MTHNRPLKKLGEIVDILDNQRSPISSKEREKRNAGKSKNSLYPYYGATRQNGWIDDYIFDEELVLLGEDGADFHEKEKEPAYIISGKAWVNNHAHVLRGKKGILDNRFLCFYLNVFDYHGYVAGATRMKLNQGSMKNIPIPLPPLATQQLIVAKLDETFAQIDEAIATTQANIDQTDELTKSVLDKVFEEGEWEKVKLEEIITLNYGKGLDKKDRDENGLYNVYGANGVLAKSDKYLIEGDSIIVGRKGSAGALTRINGKFRPTDVTYYVTLNKKGNMDYIYLVLQNLNLESLAKGVKPGINRNEVYEIKIPLPPLDKQQEIVSYLDHVFAQSSQLKEQYQKKLVELKALKASILQSAFEGKLV